MSFISGLAPGISVAQGAARNIARQSGLLTELTGEVTRVQFVQDGLGTVLSLDACLNETHSRETQPTAFPVESGSLVSDHILVLPQELTLTGVISDNPIYDSAAQIRSVLSSAITSRLPPLGQALYTNAKGAAALYNAVTGRGAAKPTAVAYQTLLRLQAGDPTASPPVPPEPFNVLTKYQRYTGMVIRSLTFPRDQSTGEGLVFTVTLTKITRVRPQFTVLNLLANPPLAADKQVTGEKAPVKVAETGAKTSATESDAELSEKVSGASKGRALEKASALSKFSNKTANFIRPGA